MSDKLGYMRTCGICGGIDVGGQIIHRQDCRLTAEALAASRLELLREIHKVIVAEPLMCPVCGAFGCSLGCELAEELGDE